jgi:hypothetical protein
MLLTIHAEGHSLPLEVPDHLLAEAEGFFRQLDSDMDHGWQMAHRWVEQPGTEERCRIIADRLLNAMHMGKAELGLLLAAYILARRPGTTAVRIDDADMNATEFV